MVYLFKVSPKALVGISAGNRAQAEQIGKKEYGRGFRAARCLGAESRVTPEVALRYYLREARAA